MQQRSLGKTGLKVSVIGLGCSRLGGLNAAGTRRKAATGLINSAIDAGINLFDTADAYADGDAEALLGEALGARRQHVVLCSKGGYLFQEHLGHSRRLQPVLHGLRRLREKATRAPGRFSTKSFEPGYLVRAVEHSLRRLKTDYIDLYQLHGASFREANDRGAIDALRGLKRAGKIRHFGVGLETLEDVEDWLGLDGVGAIQLPFGLLDQAALSLAFPAARASGAGVLVRSLFGGGWLTRQGSKDELTSQTDSWRRILAYREYAARNGIELRSLALAFGLHDAVASSAIVGAHRPQQLQQLLALEPVALSTECIAYLKSVDRYAPLGR